MTNDLRLEALAARTPAPSEGREWQNRLHTAVLELARWTPSDAPDGVDFGHVVAALSDQLPPDAVIAMDAGNFGGWLHRHFPFRSTHLLLGAISGAMGLGTPAAVAAALRYPNRQVVSIIGDGGFLMTGNELATAVQHGINAVVIVFNDNAYGNVLRDQITRFDGRALGAELHNPDFVKLAEAYGARGVRAQGPDELESSLREALAIDAPTLIEVPVGMMPSPFG